MTIEKGRLGSTHDTLVGARNQLDEVKAYLDVIVRALDADTLGTAYPVLLRRCDDIVAEARLGVQRVIQDIQASPWP